MVNGQSIGRGLAKLADVRVSTWELDERDKGGGDKPSMSANLWLFKLLCEAVIFYSSPDVGFHEKPNPSQ